ncbi:MAG: hypothetical protein AUJ92_08310 [Armatimonadetes bacterium CG2_30_59_28]|nr:MAG: hypothetical protein AUJ92_08310 [Armatimonadetes bacterium CG2_30_59_28]PIU66968.1 MAG: threonine aldolase [Armatimonadetes bacterium CG07_land_8_20_14_0_80_59_28]PIX41654.1 MAG: threonine aldolase [Armatimonadetes bacterium CG_4_8_14_3_um_filter_58_9]PIY43764.1 MAG: threonine aldolase [Armatimonadetes bacterium CG_4_10_14_3_um_filter_59_10]PJB67960.1 MAG: threonine aldolase [Armatimonadetes bacterium CG_4_9_14_3_um_filter_58_7]
MHPRYQLSNPNEILSPGLLFYPAIIQQNIDRLVAVAGGAERLRPHVKTHKTREICRMQMASGIRKFKCATIAEAEMLGEVGAPDVMIAYQLIGPNVSRLAALIWRFPDTRFSCIVDHPDAARPLSEAMAKAGLTVGVFIDLDVGMHRTGIAVGDAAVQLYELLGALPGISPAGIHAYDGHNRHTNLTERRAGLLEVMDQVLQFRESAGKKGLPVPSIVAGGTPTHTLWLEHPGVDVSPGTIFLYDAAYAEIAPDLEYEWAALVLGRVISKPLAHRVTLDIGSKGISPDLPGERGVALNLKGAKLGPQSEEHWVVDMPESSEASVGDVVYIVPKHVCPTVNLYPFANIIDETGHCVDRWEIRARTRVITI